METDYTDKYNTSLNPIESAAYSKWQTNNTIMAGRDVSKDKYDYDIQGWWKQNQDQNLTGGHLTDDWKKPNHPTFSDQSIYHGVDGNNGGTWGKNQDGSWNFSASDTNMQMSDPAELSKYFDKVEPGNTVSFPP